MIYFDNAATTFPKPRTVLRAENHFLLHDAGNPGRSSHALSMRASDEVYAAREAIADLFSFGEPEKVVFTENATYALNLAIKTSITKPCHVLISDLEHNAVLRPIEWLKRNLGIEYSVFRTGGDLERSIAEKLRPDTKAIVSTLGSNVTGRRIPLPELSKVSRTLGVLLIVDASQAAGHEKIDLSSYPCDVFCAPGHKGLFGTQGSGFAIFCDKRKRPTFIEGGSGTESTNPCMPDRLPERYEPGTLPTAAIVSLRRGAEFVKRYGEKEIEKKLDSLTEAAKERLYALPEIETFGGCSGILSFRSKKIPPSVLARELDGYGICVRAGLHCAPLAHKTIGTLPDGTVRLGFSVFNKRPEVDKFYKAMKDILKKY